jgi:hypothetical protein
MTGAKILLSHWKNGPSFASIYDLHISVIFTEVSSEHSVITSDIVVELDDRSSHWLVLRSRKPPSVHSLMASVCQETLAASLGRQGKSKTLPVSSIIWAQIGVVDVVERFDCHVVHR